MPFDQPTLRGLSTDQARQRLQQDGPHELPRSESRGLLHTALHVLRNPMILLLLAAGGVYLVFGDREEAILLLASIGLCQERRTENALEALRDLSSPRALVICDLGLILTNRGIPGPTPGPSACAIRTRRPPGGASVAW